MAAPYETGFLGMRGSGDWSSDERPQNWRQMILRLFPTGMAPLTAITSKMKSERTDDPRFNWFEKDLADQGGAVSNIYIDNLSTAYVYATHQSTYGIADATLYVKVAEAVANHFAPNKQVALIDQSRSDVELTAYVKSVVKAGANSYLVVQLLEDDDNSASSSTYNLSTVDLIRIIGNGQPEGANMPESIAYDPSPKYNFTQIFMTPLSITRTAQKTRLRTGDAYQEAKMEALQYHSIEMERAWYRGQRYEGTGDNGQPLRFGRGIENWIKSDSDAVNSDFRIDNAGTAWLDGGEDWLDTKLEQIFRYNDNKVLLGLCGSGFLKGINSLAKDAGQVTLDPTGGAYGLQAVKWTTPFGVVMLMTAPLFSFAVEDRYKCILGDPRRLKYRYVDDTMFLKDPSDKIAGYTRRDARDELWLTEAHLELHHPKSWGLLNGGGLDG